MKTRKHGDRVAIVLAVALGLVASPAFAHPAPFSYLDLRIQPTAISGSIVLHVIDIGHDLDIAPAVLVVPPELEQVASVEGGEVFSAYLPGPRGPVFMSLIERTFGKQVTTRTWETVRKVAR